MGVRFLTWVLLTALWRVTGGRSDQSIDNATSVIQCDVVVIGGSVAGLSAAVTAAKEGADVCLLEPTDMLGGQMTANGVPALDFSPEDCKPGTAFNTR
jgi:heterodisulfide reductase subunit A-like polyferredoxin